MAQQHKAPTQVTIARTHDESALHDFVARYWMPAAGVCVAAAAAVVFWNYRAQEKQTAYEANWSSLVSQISSAPITGVPRGAPAQLDQVASELKNSPVGAWARLVQASSAASDGDKSAAESAFARLQQEHPDHFLATSAFASYDGSASASLSQIVAQSLDRQAAWAGAHAYLQANPLPAEGAPRVTLVTDKGVITVQLYQDKAPQHVENFLKLCREGFYNGTRFHRVVENFMIQGGDPNSKLEDPSGWGQGGPGWTLPREANDLYHFAGVLSMAKKATDWESSGSQFFITTGAAHHLDGEHVVFGTVVAGMDVVRAIAAGEIAKDTGDRPVQPVTLLSADVQ